MEFERELNARSKTTLTDFNIFVFGTKIHIFPRDGPFLEIFD